MSAREELKYTFQLLDRYKDLFISAHLETGGEINDPAIDSDTVKTLLEARLVWQPSDDEPERTTPELTKLFGRVLRDHRRLILDMHVANIFKDIKDNVHAYKNALYHKKNYEGAEVFLEKIEDIVYDLSNSLLDRSRNLWDRINSDFGYVSSLETKIQENEIVLKQTKRLNDSLEAISANDIYELSGNNLKLRRCLNRWLLDAVEKCRKETADAIYKLTALLYGYREKQKLCRLVDSFYRRYQSQPGYQPLDYTGVEKIPEVFNQVVPLFLSGHANFTDPGQELEFVEIIEGLRKETPPIEEEEVTPPVYVLPEDPPIIIPIPALSKIVEDFYRSVMVENKKMSALEWFPNDNVEIDVEMEMWLYAVISRFSKMNRSEQELFRLEYEQSVDTVFNGKYLVHDVYVSMKDIR